ncbi:hypothetical protein ACFZ8E_25170 [Methylobacterium sp. HMF5984]|uniref:hypothetical protein n=1 Tax=Methylobacterium sp. HMF5984 TaxID=3367370 RepID=UPI0038542F61
MLKFYTAADLDPDLASLLGRASQAASFLEDAIESTLVRLLPMTMAMGSVIFASNSVSRNLTILEGLLNLPEVAIDPHWREQIRGYVNEARSLLGDRNELLHGRIIDQEPGARRYVLIQHKADGRGDRSSMTPLDLEYVAKRISRMQEIGAMMSSVPHAEYDLSKWAKGFREYPTKPSPTAPKPDRKRRPDRS